MRRRQSGFTLLEVLIASVLLAVIMTLLLGAFRIGARSWDSGERRAEQVNRMVVVQNFLRSHLSGTLPLMENLNTRPAGTAGSPPLLLFQGGPERLQYVGTLPPQVRGGLYRFEIYVADDGEVKDLHLSIRPISGGKDGADVEPLDDVVVLEELEEIKISYLAVADDGSKTWVNEWRKDTMPAMVRIDIAPMGERPWPPVVIEPHVDIRR